VSFPKIMSGHNGGAARTSRTPVMSRANVCATIPGTGPGIRSGERRP
jgi:hypothetical protein